MSEAFRSASSEGSEPLRELPLRSSLYSVLMPPSSDGMEPLCRLLSSSRYSSAVSAPNSCQKRKVG